jgi:hypothetical protein
MLAMLRRLRDPKAAQVLKWCLTFEEIVARMICAEREPADRGWFPR